MKPKKTTNKIKTLLTDITDWAVGRCVARHYYHNVWNAPSPRKITANSLRRLRKYFHSERWVDYYSQIRWHRHQERRLEPEACQERRNEIKQIWQKRRKKLGLLENQNP